MTRNKARKKISEAHMMALALSKKVKAKLPKISKKRKQAIFDEAIIRTVVITAVTILIRTHNRIKR